MRNAKCDARCETKKTKRRKPENRLELGAQVRKQFDGRRSEVGGRRSEVSLLSPSTQTFFLMGTGSSY